MLAGLAAETRFAVQQVSGRPVKPPRAPSTSETQRRARCNTADAAAAHSGWHCNAGQPTRRGPGVMRGPRTGAGPANTRSGGRRRGRPARCGGECPGVGPPIPFEEPPCPAPARSPTRRCTCWPPQTPQAVQGRLEETTGAVFHAVIEGDAVASCVAQFKEGGALYRLTLKPAGGAAQGPQPEPAGGRGHRARAARPGGRAAPASPRGWAFGPSECPVVPQRASGKASAERNARRHAGLCARPRPCWQTPRPRSN